MPRVAIGVGAYPSDQKTRSCYIAVSVDEPIPEEFLYQTPEKIWCYYGYSSSWGSSPYLYPKILDIPAGTHTLYLAAYSPPTVPWKILVQVYGATQSKKETIWLYKGLTDTITINVSSAGAPYTKARLPYDGELVTDGLTDPPWLCEAAYSSVYPRIWSAMGCLGAFDFPICFNLTATGYYSCINPNKGEQFLIQLPIITEVAPTYNYLWWKIKEAPFTFRVTPIPVSCPTPYYTDMCYEECLLLYQPYFRPYTPPIYVARNITSTDTVTIQVGHVENDTLPPEQWVYVVDQEKTINLYNRTRPECQLPPSTAGASIRIDTLQAIPEAPIDIRPGRLLTIRATVFNNGTTGLWPYMAIEEGPANFREVPYSVYIRPGIGTELNIRTLIDSTIASQGYVTVKLGYYEPLPSYPSGTLLGSMAGKVLYTYQIPLTFKATEIWNVKLEATAPPISASINNVSLEKTGRNASINNVSLEVAGPTRAVNINNVKIEVAAPTRAVNINNVKIEVAGAPPPPPPAEYATITGRVVGFMGPVANAEVSLDTTYTVKTRADGTYTFTNIPLGSYTLTAKPTSILDKMLYSSTSVKLDVPAPVTITKNITLPINWTALAAGGGISIAAVIATTAIKPRPAAVY